MSTVRQYIGARYVIKIYENSQDPSSAEWEQGNFEPLVMVTWQNGSYLSKKEVPASVGNPADNPDYWVQTGFYNGQIASLQAQIDAINNTVIPGINSEINTLSALAVKKPKNIIMVGDSWGTGQYANHGWVYYIEQMLTDIDNLYTCAANGAGFVGYNSVTYIDTLATIENSISDPDSIDLVIVAGGLNDQTASSNDLSTAIKDFVDHIDSTYPNAIVLNVAINNYLGYANLTEMRDNHISVYGDLIGYKNKYSFIDKRYSAPSNQFVNDNHLTDAGNEVIAHTLYSLIHGYDYKSEYCEFTGTAFTNTSLTGTDKSVTVSTKDKGDHVFISIGSCTVGSWSPSGFLTSAEFNASDINLPFNPEDYSHVVLCSASIDGGATYQTFPALWRVTDHNTITLDVINLNRGSSVTYTNFYIYASTIIVPKSCI